MRMLLKERVSTSQLPGHPFNLIWALTLYHTHEKFFRLDNLSSYELLINWLYPELKELRYRMEWNCPDILSRTILRLSFILVSDPFTVFDIMKELKYGSST